MYKREVAVIAVHKKVSIMIYQKEISTSLLAFGISTPGDSETDS
jgi:hypothetical protein